jgi:hypothetical protein
LAAYWERWKRAAATDFAHTNFDPRLTGTSGMLKGPPESIKLRNVIAVQYPVGNPFDSTSGSLGR